MSKRPAAIWMAIAFTMILVAVASWMAPTAKAQFPSGAVVGVVYDQNGKPFADVTVLFEDEQGKKTEVKTDKNGKYEARNIRAGIYTVKVKSQDKQLYQFQVKVDAQQEVTHDVNFKELIAKEGGAAAEAVKKQEEEKQKFEGMKAHFDAGVAALTQVSQARAELRAVPADQRAAVRQKLSDAANQAVTEFEASQKAAPEKDQNLHLIWAKLGESYDAAGKNEEAVDAYQKAIALKPEMAGYYNNLGNAYARLGKIDDAKAAYQKSAELDPPNAATAWRNFGIVLTNLGRMKEAVEPLKKAVEIDPKSAQGWYLLAGALLASGEQKQVGDKLTYEVPPETAEAYQKAMSLDPNGPIGKDAKAGLEALQQLAPGIQTKVNTRKKKS